MSIYTWSETYNRSNFAVRTSERGEKIYDYFAPEITRAIRNIKTWTPHKYVRGEHMSNIAYRYYGNTTAEYFIIVYNGIVHALGIPDGMLIKIPSIKEIDDVLNGANSIDLRGSVVKI